MGEPRPGGPGRRGRAPQPEEPWRFDPIYFEGVLRRSGNSLVVTIPPELIRRFLLAEGQRVRLVGMVRGGLDAEGAICIQLGRFVVREKARVLFFRFKVRGGRRRALGFMERLAERHEAAELTFTPLDGGAVECRLTLTSLTRLGPRSRDEAEPQRILEECRSEAFRSGVELTGFRVAEECIEWRAFDPSPVQPSSNLTCEWVL